MVHRLDNVCTPGRNSMADKNLLIKNLKDCSFYLKRVIPLYKNSKVAFVGFGFFARPSLIKSHLLNLEPLHG